ncbi:MAG: response regulator [Blastocatellia bacterium]
MRLEVEQNPSTMPIVENHSASQDSADRTAEANEYLQFGIRSAQAGNRNEARVSLFKATEIDNRNEAAWLWLASISEYPEELLVFLNNVLAINPENARAIEWKSATNSLLAKTFVQRGVDAIEENRKDFAAECFDRALEHDQNNETAWLWMASLSESNEGKLGYLEKVLNINPDNKEALTAFAKAKSEITDGHLSAAKAAAFEGRKSDADELLKAVLDESPDCEDAWILKSYFAEGFEEKIASFERVLQINPENLAARASLDSLRAIMGPAALSMHEVPAEESIEQTSKEAVAEPHNERFEFEPQIDKNPTQELELPEHVAAKLAEMNEGQSSDTVSAEEVGFDYVSEEETWTRASVEPDVSFAHEEVEAVKEETPAEVWPAASETVEMSEYDPAPETADFDSASVEEVGLTAKNFDDFVNELNSLMPSFEDRSRESSNGSAEVVEYEMEPEEKSFEYHDEQVSESDYSAADENDVATEFSTGRQTDEPKPADAFEMVSKDDPLSEQSEDFSDSMFGAVPKPETSELDFNRTNLYNTSEFSTFVMPPETDQSAANETSTAVAAESEQADPEPSSSVNPFEALAEELSDQEKEETYFSPFSPTVDSIPMPDMAFPSEEVFNQTIETNIANLFGNSSEERMIPATIPCSFCFNSNEANSIVCHSCLAVLTLSDLDMLLGNQHADKFVLRQAVERLERERQSREFTESELTMLGIGHLNLRNLQFGYGYLLEASRMNPNNVVLAAQVNALLIRLEDIKRQDEVHEAMPKGKTILVVDDSPTVLKLIAGKLEKSGHEVYCSADGIEALERLKNLVPDLILLDINMPRMDGYQVCKMIRQQHSTKDVPIVMISGKDGFFDKVRGRMAGTSGYITKPFGPETLMKAVETFLSDGAVSQVLA